MHLLGGGGVTSPPAKHLNLPDFFVGISVVTREGNEKKIPALPFWKRMEKQTLDITAENGRGGMCVQKMLYSDTPLAAVVPLRHLWN